MPGIVRIALTLLIAAVTTAAAVAPAAAAQDPRADDGSHQRSTPSAAKAKARGFNLSGLTKRRSGPCKGMYQVDVAGRHPLCTVGPDPAPKGVDITGSRSVRELRAGIAHSKSEAGMGPRPASVACVGDGKSGHRVQAIYAVASNKNDRYPEIAPLIRQIAAIMDEHLMQSAAKTGGERHIRWVTRADCKLDVKRVVVSPNAVANFDVLIAELRQKGFKGPKRKYHAWVDHSGAYCGIATTEIDNRPWSINFSNARVGYARTDEGCWFYVDWSSQSSELHEVFHNLGAVQRTAPNASFYGHCTDEWDLMCYQDGSGLPMTYTCPEAEDALLDCNDDDYFSTSPPKGSWLAGYWNTADSLFLTGSLTQPPAAITGVSARGDSSSSIRLAWKDVSGEESYSVRCRDGDIFKVCKSGIAAGQTAARINGLKKLKWYDYKVCVHGVGGQVCSAEVSARTLPKSVIVDDKSRGFRRYGRGWYSAKTGYNGRSLWLYARRGAKRASAVWKASLKYPGTYEILAKIPKKNATTSAAKYKVVTPKKTVKRKRDQYRNRGKWMSLGEHTFKRTGIVKLSDSTGERLPWRVVFDAVKFVPVDVRIPGDPASVTGVGHDSPAPQQANQPPIADAGGPYKVREGDRISLDARGSRDKDGSIESYLWSRAKRLDDATRKRPWFSVEEDGVRIITLTVTDDDGATDSAETKIKVKNAAPVAEVTPPERAPRAGSPFDLDTITFSDGGSLDTHTVTVDWGDDTSSAADVRQAKGTASASHTYATPGPVTVRVTVTDDDGGSDTVRLDLMVGAGEGE